MERLDEVKCAYTDCVNYSTGQPNHCSLYSVVNTCVGYNSSGKKKKKVFTSLELIGILSTTICILYIIFG